VKRKTLFISLISIVFFAVCAFAFLNLGNWLIVSNPLPNNADVIFVFSGEYKRLDYALQLTKKYPNATLLCSSEDYTKRAQAKAEKAGLIIDIQTVSPCSSTIDEIQHLKKYLEEQERGVRSEEREGRMKLQKAKAC